MSATHTQQHANCVCETLRTHTQSTRKLREYTQHANHTQIPPHASLHANTQTPPFIRGRACVLSGEEILTRNTQTQIPMPTTSSPSLVGINPTPIETGTPITMLTLRDKFAIAALPTCIDMNRRDTRERLKNDRADPDDPIEPGLPVSAEDSDLTDVAHAAYLFADALLKARTANLG